MRRLALFTIIALLVITACGSGGDKKRGTQHTAANDDSTMRIAYVPTLAALPLFVAEDNGLFAAAGLDVALIPFAAAMDIDTALIGGSADGAVTDLFRVAQLWRKDSVQMCIVRSTAEQWTLISNSAARINRAEQMGDKMVAMTRFSATDYLSDRFFATVKKTLPHFKVQINDVELRRRMIDNNEMDAAWLPEPYATRAMMAGHKELFRAEEYKLLLGVLALRQAYVERVGDKRNIITTLAKAYDSACDTINKYGISAYLAQMTKYCGVDSAVVSRLPATTFPAGISPDSTTLNLSRRLLEP